MKELEALNIKCDICNYTYISIHPINLDEDFIENRIECPNCHLMTYHEIVPFDENINNN